MKLNGLTNEECAVFEWQYGYCGDFKKAIWNAIVLADEDNLLLLCTIFPDMIHGYLKYTRESGWWQEVQRKAKLLDYLKY